jgi:hypothetical protein
MRQRREKSTRYFEIIQGEDSDEKKWKKTEKWKEQWF